MKNLHPTHTTNSSHKIANIYNKAMAQKNKNNKNNRNKIPRNGSVVPSPRTRTLQGQLTYSRVSDPVVKSIYTVPAVAEYLETDSTGQGAMDMILSCYGAKAYTPSGVPKQVFSPQLPWLYQAGRNFGSFRILRANLVVVGSVGSAVTGTVAVKSSKDFSDTSTNPVAIMTGGETFDLASLAQRNKVIPLHVDTTWKKVTDSITIERDGSIVAVNSVNDLIFSHISVFVRSGPVTTKVAYFYVEYDVQFTNPMSIVMNA